MDKKITKERFVSVVISNALSDEPLTIGKLASDVLKISRRWFYDLYLKYSDDIDKEAKKILGSVRIDAIKALKRKLGLKSVKDDTIFKTLTMSGDYSENTDQVPASAESQGQTIINVANMETKDVAKLLDEKLRRVREKNRRKPKGKN